MAIKNIKEIINNKGYVINPEDRKIFEEGDLQSFFGFSNTDAIEFIVYDVNDNQLPQLNGDLIRYINLTTSNINDYFLIPEGTLIQKYTLPKEFFIDVERLLNEAGYTNGIFKTQVTLINKRAGSEKEFDKLWIQEISPSRLEVRLFPLKKGLELNPELQRRYNIFVRGGDFREDTLQLAFQYIEKVKPNDVVTYLKSKYTEKWLNKVINEFKIKDIQSFVTQLYESFIKSVLFEFTNRKSAIGELGYGDKKPIPPPIELSKDEILQKVKSILIQTILYYLPQRDINEKNNSIEDFDLSEDTVSQILQTEKSDTLVNPRETELEIIESTKPESDIKEIFIKDEIPKQIKEKDRDYYTNPDWDIITADDEADVIYDGKPIGFPKSGNKPSGGTTDAISDPLGGTVGGGTGGSFVNERVPKVFNR